MEKFIHEMKAGDVVLAHGGKFKITKSARESQSHRPMADHLTQAEGRSACAVAESVCIEGRCGNYFYPGSAWNFQGNFLAGKYTVEKSV